MKHIRTPHTKFHPLTGAPIVPVGFRRNGSPIWPIMGGSGDGGDGGDAGGDAGAGGDGGTGGDAGGQGGDAGQQQNNDGTGDDGGDQSPWADPTKAKAEIERLRRENASSRTTAKEQAAEEARKAVLDEFAQKLGLKEGDAAPTVDDLTKKLGEQTNKTEQAAATARDTKAELIVWQNATDLKVDAKALTDSRAFEKAIKDLDPASDTFADDVKAAAQEALKNNPKLGAAQAAGSSSVDHPGGGGAQRRTEAPSISDAVTSALGS